MNTNIGSIVKQFGNDVEGCRSEKGLVQPNMRVLLQYSVMRTVFRSNQSITVAQIMCTYTEKIHIMPLKTQ